MTGGDFRACRGVVERRNVTKCLIRCCRCCGESHSGGMFLYVNVCRDVIYIYLKFENSTPEGLHMLHVALNYKRVYIYIYISVCEISISFSIWEYGLCVSVCMWGGTWDSVKSLPVTLFRVVLQLHSDAANSLQQHGCTVVTIWTRGGKRKKEIRGCHETFKCMFWQPK